MADRNPSSGGCIRHRSAAAKIGRNVRFPALSFMAASMKSLAPWSNGASCGYLSGRPISYRFTGMRFPWRAQDVDSIGRTNAARNTLGPLMREADNLHSGKSETPQSPECEMAHIDPPRTPAPATTQIGLQGSLCQCKLPKPLLPCGTSSDERLAHGGAVLISPSMKCFLSDTASTRDCEDGQEAQTRPWGRLGAIMDLDSPARHPGSVLHPLSTIAAATLLQGF